MDMLSTFFYLENSLYILGGSSFPIEFDFL